MSRHCYNGPPKSRRRGASLSGYAIVVGLIAISAITALNSFSVQIRSLFSASTNQVAAVVDGRAAPDDPAPPPAAPDTQPNPFSFAETGMAPRDRTIESNAVTINGIDAPVSIAVSGHATAALSVNGGGWQTGAAQITNGDTVRLRMKTPANGGVWRAARAAAGGVSAEWRVRTRLDRTPDAFAFAERTGLEPATFATSQVARITGLEAGAEASLTAPGPVRIRIDGGAWRETPVTVYNDETVQLQAKTAPTGSTTRDVVLEIGGVSASWRTRTRATGPVGCDYAGDECASGMHYVGNDRYVTASGATGMNLTDRPWHDVTQDQGAHSRSDGAANTRAYLNDGDIRNPAAEYCDGLEAHGHSDWYLPAQDEMSRALDYASQIEMPTRKTYWTSSSLGNPTVRVYKLAHNYRVQTRGQPETDHPEFVTWCMRRADGASAGGDDDDDDEDEDEDDDDDDDDDDD